MKNRNMTMSATVSAILNLLESNIIVGKRERKPYNPHTMTVDTSNIPMVFIFLSLSRGTLVVTGSVVELRGRLAVASFPNNIDNIDPTNYTWVKNFSNVTRRQYLL